MNQRDQEIAAAFAAEHPDRKFDAVLIDAVMLPSGHISARIFADTKGRGGDGTDVMTSRIVEREGAHVVVTRNSRYLVLTQAATEARRAA